MSKNTLYWSLGTALLILICAAIAIVAVSDSGSHASQAAATVPAAQNHATESSQATTESSQPTTTVTQTQTDTTTQTAAQPAPQTSTPNAAPTDSSSFTGCDQNISVTPDASCQFAENVFYEAWAQYNDGDWSADGGSSVDVDAYSPVTGQTYSVSCLNTAGSAGNVVCTNNDAPSAQVMFSASAIWAYTQSEADAYAASADLGP